jgi:ribosomal-protein-alanine N-acetyltransferase
MARGPGWPVTLEEGAVGLRPHRARDAIVWSEVRCANQRWLEPWEPTRPQPWHLQHAVSEYPSLLRALRRGARSGQLLPWVITYEGRFAGQLTFGNVIRGASCSAYAGYWVDGRLAGRAIMPTALAMAVDHGFRFVGLHRIEVNIRPENVASRRVVEKLGFREEGYHPRFLHIDGAWRDHIGYALTVEDVAPHGLLARWRESQRSSR